jgi:hypothetical protein
MPTPTTKQKKTTITTTTERKAVLFAFSVRGGKMGSNYERNKFFRGLYGWKQSIKKETADGEEKEYVYERHGVLDEVPHKKVDQSSFLVEANEADKVVDFFDHWASKVMLRTFKVLLEDEEDDDLFEEAE